MSFFPAVSASARARLRASVTRPPSTFTMTQLATANRIYQRDTTTGGGQSKGQGIIPVTINPTVVGTVYARCRSVANGTTILQAPWLIGTLTATGSQTLNVTGVDARLDQFYLDLSGDGSTNWQNGTTAVAMGVLVLVSGQSMQQYNIRNSSDSSSYSALGISADPAGRYFLDITTDGTVPSTWTTPSAVSGDTFGGSAGFVEFMNRVIAASGVATGVVGKVVGATSISQWLPGQTYGDALLNTIDAVGGKCEAFWWYQGHSDTASTISGYQDALTTLFNGVASRNSFPGFVRVVSSIPNCDVSWGLAGVEAIRLAAHDWAVSRGYISLMYNDIENAADFTHPMQPGSRRHGRHAYRALRPHFGLSHDDSGAVPGQPVRTGVNIVIPLTYPAGATTLSLVGDASLQFRAYAYGDRSTPLAFDATTPIAIDNTAKTLTLKLASDPGSTANIEVIRQCGDAIQDGSANQIYDNNTDGDGITQGRQIWMPARSLRTWGGRDLTTGGSPTYGTGKFGSCISSGYAYRAGIWPTDRYGVTVDCWVEATSTGGLEVIWSNNRWLGINGNQLFWNGAGLGAGTLPNGVPKHVRVCIDGGAVLIFLDGTLLSPQAGWDRSPGNFIVRALDTGGGFNLTTANVDELAIFEGVMSTANFTPPTAPWNGNEANMIALYHFDGNALNSCTN